MHILIFLFTFLCKPGFIYEIAEDYSENPSTELQGSSDKEYYYFEDISLDSGVYLYVSNKKDTVWFYIEGEQIYYEQPEAVINEQFQLIN